MTEAELQRLVCDYLTTIGAKWARNNSGAKGQGRVKFGLRIPGVDCGGPDLVIFPKGLPVVVAYSLDDVREALAEHADAFGVELKRLGKLPSPGQVEWMRRMAP